MKPLLVLLLLFLLVLPAAQIKGNGTVKVMADFTIDGAYTGQPCRLLGCLSDYGGGMVIANMAVTDADATHQFRQVNAYSVTSTTWDFDIEVDYQGGDKGYVIGHVTKQSGVIHAQYTFYYHSNGGQYTEGDVAFFREGDAWAGGTLILTP